MNSILIISPSLKIGGIERALTVLANEFVKHNIDVTFIACLPGEQQYTLDGRVKVLFSNISYGAGIFGKFKFYTKLLLFLRKQITRIKPDVVLSFGDVFNPLVLLALLGTNHKVYISDRTSPDFKINPIARVLKKLLYPYCAGFIAQTKRMEDFQLRHISKKLAISVIPNAIDLVGYHDVSNRRDSILYVGRLSWEKGVDRLIKAFARLHTKTWKLEIVGAGPIRMELEALADELGCTEQVVFHGAQLDTRPYYLSASIFVLPSHVEGFPNALCEAMSAGLPCICFDSIPYEGIIEPEKSGLVARKDNIEDLADKLEYLISQPKQREGLGMSASRVVQQFDSGKIALRYLQFMNFI